MAEVSIRILIMGYIYLITNIINEKKYVGKTVHSDPYVRWKQHIQYAKSDRITKLSSVHSMPIVRALKKYGVKNFKFEVILKCDEKDINLREEENIKKYDSYYNGYNCTFGGEGIRKDPEQWSNHPHSRSVTCWSLKGNYICDYKTIGIALVETLGRPPQKSERSCIRMCCKGKVFQSFNYRWTWKGEKLIEWPENKQIRLRSRIYGYHSVTGEYKEWDSQADCAEYVEGDRKNNNGIKFSLDSPRNAKIHCKKWWVFRFIDGKKVPFNKIKVTPRDRGTEYYKKIAELSNQKRRRPVTGINIKTNEVVKFNSLSEASYFIKGDGNNKAVSGIIKNIKGISKYAFGHTWSYD